MRNTAWLHMAVAAVAGLPFALLAFNNLDQLVVDGANLAAFLGPAIIAAIAAVVVRHHHGLAARAGVGARSERRVAAELRRGRPAAALHSVVLGAGGDADHLVLGPVAAVIETKTGRGRVSYKDQRLRVGAKTLPRNPVPQVRRQAAAAGKTLGCYVEAVICIPDMEGQPRRIDGVHVCSLRDLRSVLAALPARMSHDEALRHAHRLSPQCGIDTADLPHVLAAR